MLLGSHAAGATTISYVWLGADVSITVPGSVTNGETFDISFSVDVSPLAPGNVLAFQTFLEASDTIDVAGSTWEYTFISDSPIWNLSFSGVLGDAITPMTRDANGYSIRLFDPVNGNYTWLWSDWNDRVVWTLHDLVWLDHTSFDLTLANFLMLPDTFSFDAPTASLPEPSTAALLGMGLCFLAAAANRAAARRRPARRRAGQ
jgi:hypothetical protein